MKDFSKAILDMDNYFRESRCLGLAGAINDFDKSITFAFGSELPERGNDFSTSTFVAIGSLTKIFTATLVLQARRMGRLGFDDNLAKLFPDSDYVCRRLSDVTILDLLTHTSGLPRDLRGKFFETGDFPDTDRMFALLTEHQVVVSPRKSYRYSNLGYAILGAILEKVMQSSYGEMISERIAKPLAVNAMQLNRPNDFRGYRFDESLNEFVGQPVYDLGCYGAAGGIWASADSLSKFFSVLLNRPSKIGLDDGDIDRMFSVYFSNSELSSGPGLAWRYINFEDDSFFTHSGAVPGYGATVISSRDTKRSVVLVSNSDKFHFAAAHHLWKSVSPKIKKSDSVVSVRNLGDYLGKFYWLEKARQIGIELDSNGGLILPDLTYKPLVTETSLICTTVKDTFLIQGGLNDGEAAVFERNSQGFVVGVWLGGMYFSKID